jgi:hypothetical protein
LGAPAAPAQEFKLGELPEQELIQQQIWVTNVGDKSVRISAIHKGCGCISALEFSREALYKSGDKMEITMKLVTVGKEPKFKIPLVLELLSENGGKELLEVAVTGSVDRMFYLEAEDLYLGALAANEPVEKSIYIKSKNNPVFTATTQSKRITVAIGPSTNKLTVRIAENIAGIFHESFTLTGAGLSKSYVITWSSKHPMSDTVALTAGLVELGRVQKAKLNLSGAVPFHVVGCDLKSPFLTQTVDLVRSDDSRATEITIKFTGQLRGRIVQDFIVRTDLPSPNDIISIPFSAVFF